MIYDTTFKNLIVSSFGDTGPAPNKIQECLLVLYSGDMPTYDQFISDWEALYFVKGIGTVSGTSVQERQTQPINYRAGERGANVVAAYGGTYYDANHVHINSINNEMYFDTARPYPISRKFGSNPTFAVLFIDSANDMGDGDYYAFPNSDPDQITFLILSISDTQGDGIVKLSTLDTSLSSEPPTLMSIEFEVNMGA